MHPKTDRKSKLIKLIHIGKSQLAMSDDEYRLLLANISGGKASSTKLSLLELNRVLTELKSMGFVVQTKMPSQALTPAPSDINEQVKLIRHLWLSLHTLGAVKNPSETALANYVRRITNARHHNDLNTKQASQVIETLKKWRTRTRSKHEQIL